MPLFFRFDHSLEAKAGFGQFFRWSSAFLRRPQKFAQSLLSKWQNHEVDCANFVAFSEKLNFNFLEEYSEIEKQKQNLLRFSDLYH